MFHTADDDGHMRNVRARSFLLIIGAGALWAIVYGLVWSISWVTFMRATWYSALGSRQMPWAEIWSVWAALNLPLGVATTAFLRGKGRASGRSKAVRAVVLVLWVPMTVGMFGWAWYESLSLGLIAIDSVVNLIGLACASLVADALVASNRRVNPPVPQS